jgi:hypothetical protein
MDPYENAARTQIPGLWDWPNVTPSLASFTVTASGGSPDTSALSPGKWVSIGDVGAGQQLHFRVESIVADTSFTVSNHGYATQAAAVGTTAYAGNITGFEGVADKAVPASSGTGVSFAAPSGSSQAIVLSGGSLTSDHVDKTIVISGASVNSGNQGVKKILTVTDANNCTIQNAAGVAQTVAFDWAIEEGLGYNIVGLLDIRGVSTVSKQTQSLSVLAWGPLFFNSGGWGGSRFGTSESFFVGSPYTIEAAARWKSIFLVEGLDGFRSFPGGTVELYNAALTTSGYKEIVYSVLYNNIWNNDIPSITRKMLAWADKVVKAAAASNASDTTTLLDEIPKAPRKARGNINQKLNSAAFNLPVGFSQAEREQLVEDLLNVKWPGMGTSLRQKNMISLPAEQ